jgi:hypothetical protein
MGTRGSFAGGKAAGKVKLSLCFLNWAPRHEGVLREWMYSSTHSLTSALDRGDWSATRPGRFTPREGAPGTHWIGSWVGPRAILDAVVKRKIPSPRRESNLRTPIVQPVAQDLNAPHLFQVWHYFTDPVLSTVNVMLDSCLAALSAYLHSRSTAEWSKFKFSTLSHTAPRDVHYVSVKRSLTSALMTMSFAVLMSQYSV